MDRALPPATIRKTRIRRYGLIAGAVVVIVLALMFLRSLLSPTLDRSHLRTSVAEIGRIAASVTASGAVVPEYEQAITSPVSSTVESISLRPGDRARAGESILRLNMDVLESSLKKQLDELAIQTNKKAQLTLELERREIDLQASYDIKVLQTKFTEVEYERTKHLYDIGGTTKQGLERASLNVDIARRELEQVTGQNANKRASLQTDLKELDLQIRIQESRVSEIRRDMSLAEARAGRDGVVTWIKDNIGAPVNPGDVLARVADLGSFKIEAQISDVHAGKLKLGRPAAVRIGKTDLDGHINSISPAVRNGILTFIVELDDKSHSSLRPNLRADVFVITSYKDDVLRVANGPFYNGSVNQEVFVLEGDTAVRRKVSIGVSNFDYVELQGDEVSAGDVVIVSDTKQYRHMDEIAVRSGQ